MKTALQWVLLVAIPMAIIGLAVFLFTGCGLTRTSGLTEQVPVIETKDGPATMDIKKLEAKLDTLIEANPGLTPEQYKTMLEAQIGGRLDSIDEGIGETGKQIKESAKAVTPDSWNGPIELGGTVILAILALLGGKSGLRWVTDKVKAKGAAEAAAATT